MQEQGTCGTGMYYGDASPGLPKGKKDDGDVLAHEPRSYGFDWPGIGPPPRQPVEPPHPDGIKRRRRKSFDSTK